MTAEEFVPFFADGWAKPKPDGFLDHFCLRFHAEARLIQPTLPTAQGWDEIEARFRDLFAAFPDYVVTVDDWAARGDLLFIEVTHNVRVGSRTVRWPGIDRILLENGLLRERIAYFDAMATLPLALRSPRTWPRLLRWNLGSFRSQPSRRNG